jgi:hypothetical protein
MALPKYTQCVKPSNNVPRPYYTLGWVTALLLIVLAPFALLTTFVGTSIAIVADIVLIALAYWYLNGRLVCLSDPVFAPDGQACAIGVVVGLLRPNAVKVITKFGDNDATMDILLANGPTSYGPDPSVFWTFPQGWLVKPNDAILNIGLSYGTSTSDVENQEQLHCEFEGSGVHDFLEWLGAILAILIALLVLLAVVPQATLLLWFLRAIAILLGVGGIGNLLAPGTRGQPTPTNSNLGPLSEGNIVFVTGDWIYDSGHAGWNEIHAVHACQILSDKTGNQPAVLDNGQWPSDLGGGLGLDTPPKVQQLVQLWCAALGDSTTTVSGGSQTDPGNNWVIHPVVDGCQGSVIF